MPDGSTALGLRRADGAYLPKPESGEELSPLDEIYVYGPERVRAELERMFLGAVNSG